MTTTPDTLAKLAACPFCGDEPRMSEDDRGFDHVYCYGCGAGGPSHDTKDEAAEAWNRRALTAQALPAAEPVGFTFSPMWLAPLDGSPVMLYLPTTADKFAVGIWHDGHGGGWGDDEGNYYTHEPVAFCSLANLERFTIRPTPQAAQQAAQATAGWQPIEAAPKDGTEIILRRGSRVGAGMWVEWPATEHEEAGEGWTIGFDGDSWDEEKAPTHWQPLPQPQPQSAQAKGDA